jgi:hypothetical protein
MDHSIKDMAKQIETIKKATLKLKEISDAVPAVGKNAERILASVKMLEINVSDLEDIYVPKNPARPHVARPHVAGINATARN